MAASGLGHQNWQSVVRKAALPPFSLQRGAKFPEGTAERPEMNSPWQAEVSAKAEMTGGHGSQNNKRKLSYEENQNSPKHLR